MVRVHRALLSVSDKRGLASFAAGLSALGVELLSTGGTAAALRAAGLAVTDVSQVTGVPELLDGRVKTLHPRIHGGLLGLRGHPGHEREMAEAGIRPIDLVAVNLYPFEATVAQADVSLSEALEQIDIGGPALIRAGAKNFPAVIVVVDPADYPRLLEALRAPEGVPVALRLALARKAFAHTARYDAYIAAYLEARDLAPDGGWGPPRSGHPGFPPVLTLALDKLQDLRYGENPHQRAALYRDAAASGGIATARQLSGKALSYNNLLDLHAAWEIAQEWAEPVAAVVKHTNPCGVATAADLRTAYVRARDADPVSAYGGILGVNRPLDAATAGEIATTFVEAIAAPGYEDEALALLRPRKSLRLLAVPPRQEAGLREIELRRISGGVLVQEPDRGDADPSARRVVTRRAPTPAEMQALDFAWRVAKHVKSNAIVLATAAATVGIGAGQMSRVDAVRLACEKARVPVRGAVLASDAFFPFRDGLDAAARAGVTAVIQPGGSVRDAEVIAAADEHGLAMVFTGVRHFRH